MSQDAPYATPTTPPLQPPGSEAFLPYWIPGMPPPQVTRPPRVWPALTLGICIIPVGAIVAGVAFAVYLAAIGALAHYHPGEDMNPLVAKATTRPGGFLMLILPGQLTFLLAAVIAGALSPQPIAQRLGYVRPRVPIWSFPIFIFATPLFGIAGAVLMDAVFKKPNAELKLLSDMVSTSTGALAVLIAATISLLPPITEETLFRGYVQRRLLHRWGPIAAISISTVLFTAAHLDPGHMLGVLPIGVWLGVVAWQCGSIWPSMACHAALNFLFSVGSRFGDKSDKVHFDAATIVILALSGLAFAASVYVMRRYRARRYRAAAPPVG